MCEMLEAPIIPGFLDEVLSPAAKERWPVDAEFRRRVKRGVVLMDTPADAEFRSGDPQSARAVLSSRLSSVDFHMPEAQHHNTLLSRRPHRKLSTEEGSSSL